MRGQRQKLLRFFQSHPKEWVSLPDILSLGIAQYNARIHELRRQGIIIENRKEMHDDGWHSWFRYISQEKQIELFKKIRKIEGIKKVFIGSGVRYDLVVTDVEYGQKYLIDLIEHHTSGQLKIAPEHTDQYVLELMGKSDQKTLKKFKDDFYKINKNLGKKQFLTYYFISAHPGCTLRDMKKLNEFIKKELKLNPEQVQIFTPTPSTYSSLIYYTGIEAFTRKKIFVEKDLKKKEEQKKAIC